MQLYKRNHSKGIQVKGHTPHLRAHNNYVQAHLPSLINTITKKLYYYLPPVKYEDISISISDKWNYYWNVL